MTLQQQVISLEIAQKLKSLGVKQESLFYWTYCPKEHMGIEWVNVLTYGRNNYLPETVSAFTVAELLELLGDKFGVLERFKQGGYGAYIPNDIGTSATGEKVADVLAELLMKVYEPKD